MDFPFPGLPRSESLVSASWLRGALDSGERELVVLEVSWATQDAASAYHSGHIPGAIHLNTDDFEDGYPTWKLLPVAELLRVIGALGITAGSTVVVYGEQVIAAARAWWVLMYAGVADVRLLNGGFAAWAAAGYASEIAVNDARPAAFSGQARAEFLATTGYLRDGPGAGNVVLADVRSRAEFDGEVSGYDYLDAKGRIPVAIHAGDADDGARLYVADNGSLRSPADIAESWREAGVDFAGEVVFSCGSGWRSSLAFFYAWLLGHERIRNYSDGWCGWSTLYIADSMANGATPGWRQEPTGNPVAGPVAANDLLGTALGA